MKYSRDRWLGYKQRFRQQAAANPGAIWTRIDPTLWNIAFAGEGRGKLVQTLLRIQPVSPLRLLLHHLSKILHKEALTLSGKPPFTPFHPHGATGTVSPVCYKWNFKPEPVCLHPRCEYWHICSTVATMQGWLKSSALLMTPSPTALENEYWVNIMTNQPWELLPTILAASAVNLIFPHSQVHHLTIVTTSAATLFLLLKPPLCLLPMQQCVQMLMSTEHVFKA